MLTLMIQA